MLSSSVSSFLLTRAVSIEFVLRNFLFAWCYLIDLLEVYTEIVSFATPIAVCLLILYISGGCDYLERNGMVLVHIER